jgi:hypothetical protein
MQTLYARIHPENTAWINQMHEVKRKYPIHDVMGRFALDRGQAVTQAARGRY